MKKLYRFRWYTGKKSLAIIALLADENQLENIGFKKMVWNGIIREFYITYRPGTPDEFDYRIAVRFNEHEYEPCNIWLIVGSNALKLNHLTIDQLITLYRILKGKMNERAADKEGRN